MTKTLGRVIDSNDLKAILSSNKDNPIGTNHKVYLDKDNKYFISTIWENK